MRGKRQRRAGSSRRSAPRSATRCARKRRFATAFLSYGVAGPIGHVVARSAKVPEPPVEWKLVKGPWFDNNLATLEVTGRGPAHVVGPRRGRGRPARPAAAGRGGLGGHRLPAGLARAGLILVAALLNAITDVPGIRVGQAQRTGDGWLTGTTVVLPPPEGAVAGVDVRGGGPGTRETDLLDPRNLVDRVHAIVLTGGSALGLAAVDGVVQRLFAAGVGFPMGGPGEVVPIVPAAVLFDLGRGGVFGRHPDAGLGAAAYDAASGSVAEGNVVGAGPVRGRAGSRAASAARRSGCRRGRPSARWSR